MPTPVRQLLSRTIYDTDGSTTDWEFAFSGGYLSTSHVKASVTNNGSTTDIPVNPAMLSGLFTLRIVPALATGQLLTIYRDTPKDLPLVDFTDEAGFTEIALDTNAKQAIFVAAEATDAVGAVSTVGVEAAAQAAALAAAQAQAAALAAASDAQQINQLLGLLSGYVVAINASGNGTQTAYHITAPQGSVTLTVFIGGIYQQRSTYTYIGGVVTFSEAPPIGTNNIEFVLDVSNPVDTAEVVAHIASAANPHNTTKAQVGLGDVDNTSDASKPVSTAQAAAIAAVAGAKQDTLVSGTNIRTINGNTLLGSGDITISGGSVGGIGDVSGLQAALDGKAALSGATFTGAVQLDSSALFKGITTHEGEGEAGYWFNHTGGGTNRKLANLQYVNGAFSLRYINDGYAGVAITPVSFDTSGNATFSGNVTVGGGTLGYGAGSGGTVTQATSKSTSVTLNKPSMRVTTHNAALAAGASVGFAIVNGTVLATDNVTATFIASLPSVNANYSVRVAVSDGVIYVHLTNESAGSLSEAVPIKFDVIKGSTT